MEVNRWKTYIRISSIIYIMLLNSFNANSQPTWKNAESIKKGDIVLLADGSVILIKHTERQLKNIPVHNFTVKELHNYYVSKEGVLVHNDKCKELEKEIADAKKKVKGYSERLEEIRKQDKTLEKEQNLYDDVLAEEVVVSRTETISVPGVRLPIERGIEGVRAFAKEQLSIVKKQRKSLEQLREYYSHQHQRWTYKLVDKTDQLKKLRD